MLTIKIACHRCLRLSLLCQTNYILLNKLCLSLNFLILICVLKGWYHFKPVSGTVLDWRRKEGSGGILDLHGNMPGSSFTTWAKMTPRHNAFVQKILESPCHIISTIRTKTDYTLSEKNGKMVPEKVGLKGITRDGMDYEFTIVFDLDCVFRSMLTPASGPC